ncbi:hypothetical protein CAOG_04006 [Capsaspora owczarzaki ATCC 30864]|nr:hypothetical protein CAOG_04006 [Capsaspora owczarzaki ATCC 30864]|eukprot:XP_004347831.1 hypothetical protein CAOG_04006 [Capsaspora owczarzaki ATCC 30864]
MAETIPATMKALVKTKPTASYELVEIPVPVPGDGELLIKVERVSICGSDINLYTWNEVGQAIATLPFTPGHECVGKVVKVGPNCGEIGVGTRIGVENHYYCGNCYQCTHDLPHICKSMGQFGHGKQTVHGGCSQYTIVPARYAYVLKTNLTSQQACLLEPFGVAQHAIEEVECKDDTLLVIGCGPIGLLTVAVGRAMGAKTIIAADVIPAKLELAKTMGADHVINSKDEDMLAAVMKITNSDGAGCIVEASGSPYMVNTCFTFLRKGGRILLVGLPKQPLHVENVLHNVIFKSLTLKTIHGRKIFHTWEESERLISQGLVDISPIVSHDIPMSKFEDAFSTLLKAEGCKILMDPQA